jgi:colanic acid biosynthesis glycosyl transferase WcaI
MAKSGPRSGSGRSPVILDAGGPDDLPSVVPTSGWRIVVHDYSGHPGQAQLSRALADRGHRVVHQHCPSYVTGKGAVDRLPGDPETLTFEPCPMGETFNRYSFLRRAIQEFRYGIDVGRRIERAAPDAVIVSNVPLLAHAILTLRFRRQRIPMVFWQQDIYSAAIGTAARQKLPLLGGLIAWTAQAIERAIARSSVAVVAISTTFLDKLTVWGVAEKTTVVPNWAPIVELPVCARHNAWSDRMGLSARQTVLYSGTLGLKHDPSILASIAIRMKATAPEARLVVVSEGRGRQWLEDWKNDVGADNLLLLDFQSYQDLPAMLASADVLLAVLEPDASKYSVPSKVLTYLCSQRPIVAVIPPDNSVAEIITTSNAGLVVDPSHRDGVADRVLELLGDEEGRAEMGRAGRRYAERAFDADQAAQQFEEILRRRLPDWRRPAMSASSSGDSTP